MDSKIMQNVLFAADSAQDVTLRPGNAGNFLQCLERPHLDVIEICLLDTGRLFQVIETHTFDDMFLNYKTILLIIDLIQYGCNVHHRFLIRIIR